MPAGRTRVDVGDENELPYAGDETDDARSAELGFRTPGGIVARSAELEQEVGQLRDRLRAMEREVYDARKMVRRTVGKRRIVSAVMTGGVGATLGALVAMVLWMCGETESAGVVLALVLPGWVFGALAGHRWEKGDFPDAPPERLR